MTLTNIYCSLESLLSFLLVLYLSTIGPYSPVELYKLSGNMLWRNEHTPFSWLNEWRIRIYTRFATSSALAIYEYMDIYLTYSFHQMCTHMITPPMRLRKTFRSLTYCSCHTIKDIWSHATDISMPPRGKGPITKSFTIFSLYYTF